MKSICIKTNNSDVIKYLLDKLNSLELDNICFSCLKFKIYTNVIIHYTGKNILLFKEVISNILSCLVIDIFEEAFINRIISHDYFYFDQDDTKIITNNVLNSLEYNKEFNCIYKSFYNYLNSNNKIVLNGFLTFRLKDYVQILSERVDKYVNKFIIEREYTEFISLLRMYINSESSQSDYVHLIYSNSSSTLLNKDKEVIQIDKTMFNAKYLSDITFSSNDYTLNVLLSLLPKKIYIHLIDDKIDEFITTLILIFENRIDLCTECPICQIYKNKYSHNSEA